METGLSSSSVAAAMKLLLALSLLTLLALAGCSGSGGAQVPSQDANGNYVIHLNSGNKFSPMVAKVPAGATVSWVDDSGVHDVTAHDESWSSDDEETGLGHKMSAGDHFEKQFVTPGEYDYHCQLHSGQGMKGTIIVEEAAA